MNETNCWTCWPSRWRQGAEARDAHGNAVRHGDPDATAWDITGGLRVLFGWRRASELFRQIWRHISDGSISRMILDPDLAAMVSLQEYDDQPNTRHRTVVDCLKAMPISRGRQRAGNAGQ